MLRPSSGPGGPGHRHPVPAGSSESPFLLPRCTGREARSPVGCVRHIGPRPLDHFDCRFRPGRVSRWVLWGCAPVLPCLTSRQSSTRKTREARNGLANHPLTREYLDAGLRLMAGQFRPESRPADDDDDEWSKQSAFFDWLSAQKVIDEVSRGGRLRGNQGTFEDRWPYKDYYIQDLLSYALWGKHWAQHAAVAEEFAEPLTTGADFVQAVHEAS